MCSFTVAVNRRKKIEGQPEADFFRVSAWNERAKVCSKFLQKGKKVCVIGPVAVSVFTGNDGNARANLEVTADEVEFLSPRVSDISEAPVVDSQTGFMQVDTDELPF